MDSYKHCILIRYREKINEQRIVCNYVETDHLNLDRSKGVNNENLSRMSKYNLLTTEDAKQSIVLSDTRS